MKKIILPLFAALLFAAPAKAENDSFVEIVAIVNGDIISTEDLDNRVNAFSMNTGVPINKETKKMITQKALNAAIDEKIKLQESQKNDIKISEKEINDAIASFERNNKMKPGEIKKVLAKYNVGTDAFREQMKSDLAWVRLVRRKAAGDANITQKEIDEAIDEAKKDLSIPKYQVSEIMIRKDNSENINGLVAKLREDPRFELYAMQFSQSPSSSTGGNLGWINKGQLPEPLDKALEKMKDGDISNPIQVGEDFYILKLSKTFNPNSDAAPAPTEEEMRNFLEKKKLETFANQYLQKLRQAAIIEMKI